MKVKEYDRRAIRIGAFIAASEARQTGAANRIDNLNAEYRELMKEAATELTPAEYEEIFGSIHPATGRPTLDPDSDLVTGREEGDPTSFTDAEMDEIEGRRRPELELSGDRRVPLDDIVRGLSIFGECGLRIELDDQDDDESSESIALRGLRRMNLCLLMDQHARKIQRQIMNASPEELDSIAEKFEHAAALGILS